MDVSLITTTRIYEMGVISKHAAMPYSETYMYTSSRLTYSQGSQDLSQDVSYLWRKLYANRNPIVTRQYCTVFTELLLRDNHQRIGKQRVINRAIAAYLDWTSSSRCIHGDE